MTWLERLLCAIGAHFIDRGDLDRRRRRMWRAGVIATEKLPTQCLRCGKTVWTR